MIDSVILSDLAIFNTIKTETSVQVVSDKKSLTFFKEGKFFRIRLTLPAVTNEPFEAVWDLSKIQSLLTLGHIELDATGARTQTGYYPLIFVRKTALTKLENFDLDIHDEINVYEKDFNLLKTSLNFTGIDALSYARIDSGYVMAMDETALFAHGLSPDLTKRLGDTIYFFPNMLKPAISNLVTETAPCTIIKYKVPHLFGFEVKSKQLLIQIVFPKKRPPNIMTDTYSSKRASTTFISVPKSELERKLAFFKQYLIDNAYYMIFVTVIGDKMYFTSKNSPIGTKDMAQDFITVENKGVPDNSLFKLDSKWLYDIVKSMSSERVLLFMDSCKPMIKISEGVLDMKLLSIVRRY